MGKPDAASGAPPAAFALACACCRPFGDADGAAAVRTAAAGVDWPRFARVVTRHRVEGLAHAALAGAGVAPDEAVSRALRTAAAEIAIAALEQASETAALRAALDGAGIANLALKGATLDILAWGRIGLKRAWDIDILVTPADAAGARRVLEARGYRLADPADASPGAFETWIALAKECVLRHPETGLIVELHWRLADAATLLPTLSALSPSQTLDLGGGLASRTLADDELFAYLCVHGASHAWSRLKWLADVGAFLARRDDAERTRLYRRAGALRAGHCPAVAFMLCERLLGLAVPPALAAEIGANRKARRLAAVALDAMSWRGGEAELDARPLSSERILASHFLFADGWRFRGAEWARQWVSVDDHMRLRLPPALVVLYAPLRVPLWLWRRASRLWPRRGAGG